MLGEGYAEGWGITGYGIVKGKKISDPKAIEMIAERQRDRYNGIAKPEFQVELRYSPNGNPEYYYKRNGVLAGGYN